MPTQIVFRYLFSMDQPQQLAFGDEVVPTPVAFVGAKVAFRQASQILTPASGFMAA